MSPLLRRLMCTSLVGLLALLPATAAAQTETDCRRLTVTKPAPADRVAPLLADDGSGRRPSDQLLALANNCASRIARDVAAIYAKVKAAKGEQTPKERSAANRELQTLHQDFHRIRDWEGVLLPKELPGTASAIQIETRETLEKSEVNIHEILGDLKLRNHFLLTFVPGASLSLTGDGEAGSGLGTSPVTYLEMQSRHVPRRGPIDIGLGGRLGVLPGTVVKEDTEDDETEATANLTNVQQALFTSTLWVDGSIRTSDASEFFLRLSIGANALLKKDTVAIKDEKVYLFSPVGDGGDNPKTTREIGLRWRYFNETLEDVHELQRFSTPAFEAGISLRTDRRLAAVGPLAGFAKPDRRIVFSLGLHDIPVYGAPAGSERVSLNLTVDYESALPNFLLSSGDEKKPKLPSSLRLLIGGSIDITPLFGG